MPYCSLLKNHMAITLPGEYVPCCRFKQKKVSDKNYYVDEISFDEYKNSSYYQSIIEDMKTGWSAGCIACKIEEDKNITSYRQHSNNIYQGEGIQYLEISLSKQCNLVCKMCHPVSSSKWEDLRSKSEYLQEYFGKYRRNITLDLENLLGDLDIKNLTHIKYLGGEPFITKEIKDLFDFLEHKNVMHNVSILINSNCTLFPKKWLSQIKKFKKFKIGLSIDGFEKSCEYSRVGSDWNIISTNLKKWKDFADKNKNIDLYIASTINVFTVHDIDKLKDFANSLGIRVSFTLINTPSQLSLEALPNEYIKKIKNKSNEKYLQDVENDYSKSLRLVTFINETDKMQKIDVKKYIPDLYKHLEKLTNA